MLSAGEGSGPPTALGSGRLPTGNERVKGEEVRGLRQTEKEPQERKEEFQQSSIRNPRE